MRIIPSLRLCKTLTHHRTRRHSQQMVDEETYSYLPYDCWECVVGFLINNDGDENLNSLSLVSKQFLSITNHLRFSLTLQEGSSPFLPLLFKRFINLTSLDLLLIHDDDLDDLLYQISNFPLKLRSLKLPYGCCFPTGGLQTFSQNITTLTSLTCYHTYFWDEDLSPIVLSPIVDCFPLLEELNLHNPEVIDSNKPIFFNSIHSLLSKCPRIQRLELNSTNFLYDQHVVDFSLFLGNLVFINLRGCDHLTETTLFSLVGNCPSLSEINMEGTSIGKESVGHSGVYPQLKSLYLGRNSELSDEILIMFASIFPNLQHLDLRWCDRISEGICQILSRCCKIRHLNLTGCSRVNILGINFVVSQLEVLNLSITNVDDETIYMISKNCCGLKHLNLASCSKVKLHGMNFAVPKLEVLNLSNTNVDDETLYMISKNCCGLVQLSLELCSNVTAMGLKHMVKNCTQLRKICMAGFHLSNKNRKLFSRRGWNIC